MTETLEAGDASVTIHHDGGGRLASFTVAGHELLLDRAHGADDPTGWGCFPMVPWAGRIRHGRFRHGGRTVELPLGMPPHAIHGTTHRKPWVRTGTGLLETDLGPDWPWRGWARQAVELTASTLSLAITVGSAPDNQGGMPVTAGWHPWFRRRVADADLHVDLPAERRTR